MNSSPDIVWVQVAVVGYQSGRDARVSKFVLPRMMFLFEKKAGFVGRNKIATALADLRVALPISVVREAIRRKVNSSNNIEVPTTPANQIPGQRTTIPPPTYCLFAQ